MDHELLHGGYLHRLSHESMILYLFLVVVGDRDGRSFYGDATIMEILRLDTRRFNSARIELLKEGLIEYRSPYWWIKNIEGGNSHGKRTVKTENTVSKRRHGDEFLSDRGCDRDFAKACLKDISRILKGREKEKGMCA